MEQGERAIEEGGEQRSVPVEEAVGLDGALNAVAVGVVDEEGEGGVVDPAGELPEAHTHLDLPPEQGPPPAIVVGQRLRRQLSSARARVNTSTTISAASRP